MLRSLSPRYPSLLCHLWWFSFQFLWWDRQGSTDLGALNQGIRRIVYHNRNIVRASHGSPIDDRVLLAGGWDKADVSCFRFSDNRLAFVKYFATHDLWYWHWNMGFSMILFCSSACKLSPCILLASMMLWNLSPPLWLTWESFIVRTMIAKLGKALIIHFTAWLPATSKVLIKHVIHDTPWFTVRSSFSHHQKPCKSETSN